MPERNFKDYKRIVEGLAYKFSLSIKDIDTEDLIQEGWVCYLKLVKEEK